jgi:hypothetical protein
MRTKAALVAIVGGVAVTLLTGLVENMPAMLVGAVHYGYPLAWLIRLVIAPEFNPWRVEYVNLIFDIIVWAVLVWLILFALSRRRK